MDFLQMFEISYRVRIPRGLGSKWPFFEFYGLFTEKFKNFPSQMFFIWQKKISQKIFVLVF